MYEYTYETILSGFSPIFKFLLYEIRRLDHYTPNQLSNHEDFISTQGDHPDKIFDVVLHSLPIVRICRLMHLPLLPVLQGRVSHAIVQFTFLMIISPIWGKQNRFTACSKDGES
jgi:phospholipid N-methyltransferase